MKTRKLNAYEKLHIEDIVRFLVISISLILSIFMVFASGKGEKYAFINEEGKVEYYKISNLDEIKYADFIAAQEGYSVYRIPQMKPTGEYVFEDGDVTDILITVKDTDNYLEYVAHDKNGNVIEKNGEPVKCAWYRNVEENQQYVERLSEYQQMVTTVAEVKNGRTIKDLPVNEMSEIEKELLDLINESRAKENLVPVKFNTTLNNCAELRCNELTYKFSHIRPNGENFDNVFDEYSIYYNGYIGEVAYSGGLVDAKSIHSALMASPYHREAIMSPYYNFVGISIVYTKNTFGEINGAYAIEMFSCSPIS